MNYRTIYWLNWEKKLIEPSSLGLNPIPWQEIEKYPLTVYCDQNTWPRIEIEEKSKSIIADEQKRAYRIGLATIKEVRGGTKENPESWGTQAIKKMLKLCPDFVSEHPSHDKKTFENIGGWLYPPRFENLKEGTFADVWSLDYKSCYANIMRNYPLPYGEPQHIKVPELIEKTLQDNKTGFVRFYLKYGAKIKNDQIPFVPDFNNEYKVHIKGRFLLHTRLFKVFKKQYKIIGKILYTDFWIFEEKKGCVDAFLNYCEELRKKPKTKERGKMLVNSSWSAIGKSVYRGYNYRAWSVAVRHLVILQFYYLCRRFEPEQIICIRGDEIYIQGKLPLTLNKHLFHLENISSFSAQGKTNIYNHDKLGIKSFTKGQNREELVKQFKERKDQAG